jgi:exodeoxyribonuclease VII small subunit
MTAQNAVESYEELYARLQEVVTRLEHGELPLAETLELYEQGVQLAAACQRQLQNGAGQSGLDS